jgi:hypothetical protein
MGDSRPIGSARIQVGRVRIPKDRVLALAHQERYVFYLLGHVFNELSMLRKFIAFAFNQVEQEKNFLNEPDVAQAMFLFKLAAMKLVEFRNAITRHDASHTIRTSYFSLREDLEGRLVAVQRDIGRAGWIGLIRKSQAAHYPSFADWQEVTRAQEPWSDDIIYLGTQTGNTFFASAEVTANAAILQSTGSDSTFQALLNLVDIGLPLLVRTSDVVQEMLDVYVNTKLMTPEDRIESIGFVTNPPNFLDVRLPFWTLMPKKP